MEYTPIHIRITGGVVRRSDAGTTHPRRGELGETVEEALVGGITDFIYDGESTDVLSKLLLDRKSVV